MIDRTDNDILVQVLVIIFNGIGNPQKSQPRNSFQTLIFYQFMEWNFFFVAFTLRFMEIFQMCVLNLICIMIWVRFVGSLCIDNLKDIAEQSLFNPALLCATAEKI